MARDLTRPEQLLPILKEDRFRSSPVTMLANIARRSIDEAHGSAAIEFALVVPVLLLLVVGAMEIGMIIYTHSAAGFATRDVARRIATNRLVVTLAPSTVKDQLPVWVRQDTTVTVDQSTPSNIFTNQ